jgi:adenine-specific DNA-methyltransferase
MKKIEATSHEAQSADITAENIAQLKALFPELLTESANGVAINVDVLKQLVGDVTATDAEEKYGLNWHGKRRARQIALTPSTGTLRPCPNESVDWNTTQNLMIEGDNLEVLKLLQKSYAGKVKLIYIDPPYNTGSDFVYSDSFQDNIKNYLELTGQVEGGRKISSNTEASGRFHTDWLSMMYPRLKLARNLLKPDGVIVISIGDKEIDNLREICSEIFGGENLVATAIWEKKNKGAFLASDITNMKDYVVVYCKEKASFNGLIGQIALEEETYPCVNAPNAREIRTIPAGIQSKFREKNYTLAKGKVISADTMSLILHSDLVIQDGVLAKELVIEGNWRYTQDSMTEYARVGDLYLTQDLYLRRIVREPRYKTMRDLLPRLGTTGKPAFPSINPNDLFADGWATNEDANEELRQLLGEQNLFDYPKPSHLIEKLICSIRDDKALILDFFAGSGTTGQAVNALNALDNGSRRCILVQLPEPLDPENKDQKIAAEFCDKLGKPRTIAELTKERLRRAGAKIKSDNPMFAGDTGFRVFKLDTSNIRAWNPDRDNLEKTLLDHEEHILPGRSEADIVYELLLKLGLDLCVPIESRAIAGKTVGAIGGGVLLACLAEHITTTDVEALAQGIVAWRKELAPAGDTTCVFRDSAFENDIAKSNLAAILEQYGIANVRSL